MKFWEAMKALGEGKRVRRKDSKHSSDFSLKMDSPNGRILYGDGSGPPIFYEQDQDAEWEIVEKPKPKIKRWLWAYKSNHCDGYSMTSSFYSFEEMKNLDPPIIGYIKLLWSETEFDE